ncbi:hypothetical protein HMPREF9081_2308 [Centipeda periodontii DSM 2778]|uniref:Uncharacterized protein n=1 Tax=Centipeda periodontii DSM 2778 TaxID=888060 RepID=F5RPW1_9FIRM|nr:hypothetical protein HMPREF9081_2308 [Centipeda periodontii DSM 2778]
MRGDTLSPKTNAFLTESVIFYALHLSALHMEQIANDLIPYAARNALKLDTNMIDRRILLAFHPRTADDPRHEFNRTDPRNIIDLQCSIRVERHGFRPCKCETAAAQIHKGHTLRGIDLSISINEANRCGKVDTDAEKSTLLKALCYLGKRKMKNGNAPLMASVTAMHAKEAIVASVPCRKHIEIFADVRNHRNTAFVHRHGNNEVISDNVLYTTRVAGDFLLVVFKEYFQPLSDS